MVDLLRQRLLKFPETCLFHEGINGSQRTNLDTLHAIGLSLAPGVERWTAMEGGFPIIIDGQCLGGIGVSGGDWQQDEDIAKAAISAVGALL